jgi:hypothetical protein
MMNHKWFVDEQAMDVVLVECVKDERKDARGNDIYGNTHFDDEGSAWVELAYLAMCMYDATCNRYPDRVGYYLRGCEELQKARNNLAKRLAMQTRLQDFHNAELALADGEYFTVEVGVDGEWHPVWKPAGTVETFAKEADAIQVAVNVAKETGGVARVVRFRKQVVFLSDEEPPSLQVRELFN